MAKTKRKRAVAAQSSKGQILRHAVLQVAARLFAERGFGGTNLQDIADELGISRPALYYYFKSKDHLLASMVEEVTVFSGQRTTELAAKADSNPGETLRQMAQSHARWLLEHPVEFKMVDRSENDLPAAVRATNDRAKRVVLDNFTRIIERGIEIGHFRPVDARVTAFTIIGMCSWTAWWFRSEGRLSATEVAEQIADLAVHAVKRADTKRTKAVEIADAVEMLRDDLAMLERVISPRGSKSS